LRQSLAKFKNYKKVGAFYNASGSAVTRWCWFYGIENVSRYKLTAEDIPLIRALKGSLTADEVAEKFEVAPRTIRDVWAGKTWAWVE